MAEVASPWAYRPFGRHIPVRDGFWKLFYRVLGVPAFRSQLLWRHLWLSFRGIEFSRWLDVGCGAGAFLVELASLFPEASFVGIDRDGGAIDRARGLSDSAGLSNVVWYVTSAEAYAGTGHDVVSCLGVLEFAAEPSRTMRRMGSFVRKGGHLFVSVPHQRYDRPEAPQAGRFSANKLRSLMEAAGCVNPTIVGGSRGLGSLAYHQSLRLQHAAWKAAAYHIFSMPLVFVDSNLPGRADLLFGLGTVENRM